MVAHLSSLYEHPLKSGRGRAVEAALVLSEGLAFDRRFLVHGPDGTFVSGRSHPRLVLIDPAWDGVTLRLRAPGQPDLVLEPRAEAPSSVAVWKDRFDAWDQGEAAAAWLSSFLGDEVRLAWLGESRRPLRWDRDRRVTFADAAPLLLIGTASLEDLSSRVGEPLSMRRFRPNLVVSGTSAFEEDTWRRLRIGEVEFLNLDGCGRCEFTTIDPETGERHPKDEPKATLEAYRRTDTGIYFGTNLMALTEGTLRVGDRVEVLETRRPLYFGVSPLALALARVETELGSEPGAEPAPDEEAEVVCLGADEAAPGLRRLVFGRLDGRRWAWQAGQHLTLEVPVDGEVLVRSYSLLGTPQTRPDGALEVAVKRVEGGRASAWLHDRLAVGTRLRARAVAGSFTLEAHPWDSLLLLGAGSGMTPLLALARFVAEADLPVDLAVHLSVRRPEDAAFGPEWADLARRLGPRLNLAVRVTEAEGRLDHQALVKFCPDLRDRKAFVCGPPAYRAAIRGLLAGAGFKVDRRYVEEVFGEHALEAPASPQPGTVRFLASGRAVASDGLTTVLQLADRAGVPLASSCRAGDCGICRVTTADGRVLLACETFPEGDLSLEL